MAIALERPTNTRKHVELHAGNAFGYLTVLERGNNALRNNGAVDHATWICRCICGTEKNYRSYALRAGIVKSCGCISDAMGAKKRTRHAGSNSPEHNAWKSMKYRCSSPNHPQWHRYGGRGISVCARWNVFENFIADMGHKPSKHHSIERLNNAIGYAPENCVWATQRTQMQNTRRNVLIIHNGVTRTISEWARLLGINYRTLHLRIRTGWPIEIALNPASRARVKGSKALPNLSRHRRPVRKA